MPRRILAPLVVAATIVARVQPAHAGLDLTWNACDLASGAASNVALDCEGGATARLFGSFQVASDFDLMSDMFATLEVRTASGDLPSFWQMGPGGCNDGAIQLTPAMPPSACPAPAFVSPWPGLVLQELGYAPDPLHPGRAALELHLLHKVREPYALRAGINYFGFLVTISTARAAEGGGECAGCADPVVLVWRTARFVKLSGTSLTLSGPGFVSQCATLNGAPPGLCAATPARRRTWGTIQALYR